jgi:hypothetical protein
MIFAVHSYIILKYYNRHLQNQYPSESANIVFVKNFSLLDYGILFSNIPN